MNTPAHIRLDMNSNDCNRALTSDLKAEYAYRRSYRGQYVQACSYPSPRTAQKGGGRYFVGIACSPNQSMGIADLECCAPAEEVDRLVPRKCSPFTVRRQEAWQTRKTACDQDVIDFMRPKPSARDATHIRVRSIPVTSTPARPVERG